MGSATASRLPKTGAKARMTPRASKMMPCPKSNGASISMQAVIPNIPPGNYPEIAPEFSRAVLEKSEENDEDESD